MQIDFLTKSIFIAIPLLFLLTACEDKKSDNSHIPTENATQVLTDEEIPYDTIEETSEPITLTLIGDQNLSEKITLSHKKLTFHNLQQGVILFNLFNTSSPASLSQTLALDTLQKKYKEKLFVVSLLTDENVTQQAIDTFKKNKNISHHFLIPSQNRAFAKLLLSSLHLSKHQTLPIAIIYKDGNYYSDFEGPVPIEMIQYDIEQAMVKR